ncbi:membrane-associating domain-containing protein [Pochonia chlamydosporia 170]|uniref:Membrane-associating domain-containing protein n=1 Tax=Pochonia chlamydosporia 170 TaxID=1380566 RepID=A0A179GA39_METCM|nr:membrane-associating domain-containing protein [Pochonia chlamydosporia 170]OAQ74360.2 membrane-associating domain-containing protein [Pochonia chlamydosporia 170]
MGTPQSLNGSVNFLLAASIISILSILYLELAPRFAGRLGHPYAYLGVEGMNTVFYFAGFIALAVYVGNLTFCTGRICSAARADAVIAAGAFCAWIASTILTAKQMIVGGAVERRKAIEMREV